MALRLTFGGSPCPSLWGYLSDSLADVCNALINNPYWDHNTSFDSLSFKVYSPLPLPDSTPFHKALPMSVQIPENDLGKVDIYLDDSIGVSPDVGDNAIRVGRSIPFVIHALARPLDETEQLPRKDIISLKKFSAEGRLEESKLILGWSINTQSLSVSLPKDKFDRWSADIYSLLSSPRVKHKSLESTIGRLNHVAAL